MDESILNHLFLPHYLPSSADDDYLIENNHQNEYILLECMEEYLNSFTSTDILNWLPILGILAECVQRWSALQDSKNISVSKLQSAIEELPSGGFLPLYFNAQNAAILIEMDENDNNQPIISSWQVSLPSTQITSSFLPHFSCFPVRTYRLNNRSQLISKVHCELLIDFMINTIEYSKSYKSSREVDETRELPESHYICQWWIQHFKRIKIENNSNISIQFNKKHRDHIRWNHASLPFRRSGLWMTIKVVFQTILTKRLKHIGTIIYKLLITNFLTYVIYTRIRSTHVKISIDLLVHCIRKIVRRLNKIESLLLSIDSNNEIKYIDYMKKDIEMKINEIFPKIDWQKSIREYEQMNNKLILNNLELNHSQIYQHLFLELKAYLNNQNSNEIFHHSITINNHDDCTNLNHIDNIPSIEEFTTKFNYTIGIALTRVEIWVKLYLKQWINQPLESENHFKILLKFYEEYQKEALNSYWSENGPTDPIGYSRFILTSLTIIRIMHENLCNNQNFEQLELHSIDIPNLTKLFEMLILPDRQDMIDAWNLYEYFNRFRSKSYPDLLTDIKSENAFGVRYAKQSESMNKSIEKIRNQIRKDKKKKIKQMEEEKTKYIKLIETIKDPSCECNNNQYYKKSCRCGFQQQANCIKIRIYECPLPSNEISALAVIFELQMPIEIRCYRDILWQFINRPYPNPKLDMYEWLNVSPHAKKLGSFYTGPIDCKVKLVSQTKPITLSHYSNISISSATIESILHENSLKVQISPIKPIKFEDECHILTPQIEHPDYKQLQFSLNNTKFVQNHVIAKLSNCPLGLKPTQFIEFGSFRSGHYLQWWNLLIILEMNSLSIAEESVAILIIHSILQYGPFTSNSNYWCSQSHEQLLEDHFLDEFILRLDRHLNGCKLNWKNELVLIVLTMITMRILTICNSTRQNQLIDLALKCRRIGEQWIDLISESISSALNEVEIFHRKIITIATCCLLTFSTHTERINCLLSSNEHVLSFLKAIKTIQDNTILIKNQSNISHFMKNIMRYSQHISVMIQPTLAKYLEDTSYESLNRFIAINWSNMKQKSKRNKQWKKRNEDIYDGWYDCQYESRSISIDCINGTFLVDDRTVNFLPVTITSTELFIRVFGNHIFQVQPNEFSNTYITKQIYHNNVKVQYEFHFNDQNKRLIIKERHIQSNKIFQLIPHSYFQNELPNIFVDNYSHWWNDKQQIVEFRPVYFKNDQFLKNISYKLSIKTGYITTVDTMNTQILIKTSSTLFQNLFNQYFFRLDDEPYIYMMKDDSLFDNNIIHIHLSRLGLAFKYNTKTNLITSREYSDMCIDKDQWLGTLTGLKSGLLLSPLSINNKRLKNYPYRKLLVPFGEICASSETFSNHQTVTIQRTSSMLFSHEYFIFIINDRLKILQSTDSPTGWLYLSLLHAMTSHPLPDEYTGMTGMERAFQLLNSAGCWSDQPFDLLSLNILSQIAAISPKVNYYPEYLTRMEKIQWNTNGIPYSMQHFGYYLITKTLIESSQQFNFMYPSSISNEIPKIFHSKEYNKRLLTKLYWDYRDSYNPMTRLCLEMKENISRYSELYQLNCQHCSYTTNYNVVRLMDNLYKKGNLNLKDISNQYWLPLSQWLIDENQLSSIWIGLLNMINNFKIINNIDQLEKLEKLIDFLHYIFNKVQIKPFYLQMLQTALKISVILPSYIIFPSFIEYFNIEDITVIKERIELPNFYTVDIRNKILLEVENCWQNNCKYEKRSGIKKTKSEESQINQLLISWKNNRQLRIFLEFIQNYFDSISIEQFHKKVPYHTQKFTIESLENQQQDRLIENY